MKTYLYIGFGGFVGAIFRILVKELYFIQYKTIPWSTIFINISGSFLLALILTFAFELGTFNADIKNGLTIGLLGAYTTFSGFCKETINLILTGAYYHAMIYCMMSLILGITAIYAGYYLANYISLKLIKKDSTVVYDE
jgi:CrcB protein